LAELRSSFAAYAELTEPVELTATPVAERSVAVAVRQAGADIAEVRIDLAIPAMVPDRALGRGTTWLGPRS
jgi:hypothetical protein